MCTFVRCRLYSCHVVTRTPARTHAHTRRRMHGCRYAHRHTCSTAECTHACAHTHTPPHARMQAHTRTHTHTQPNAMMHTHTDTHMFDRGMYASMGAYTCTHPAAAHTTCTRVHVHAHSCKYAHKHTHTVVLHVHTRTHMRAHPHAITCT